MALFFPRQTDYFLISQGLGNGQHALSCNRGDPGLIPQDKGNRGSRDFAFSRNIVQCDDLAHTTFFILPRFNIHHFLLFKQIIIEFKLVPMLARSVASTASETVVRTPSIERESGIPGLAFTILCLFRASIIRGSFQFFRWHRGQ